MAKKKRGITPLSLAIKNASGESIQLMDDDEFNNLFTAIGAIKHKKFIKDVIHGDIELVSSMHPELTEINIRNAKFKKPKKQKNNSNDENIEDLFSDAINETVNFPNSGGLINENYLKNLISEAMNNKVQQLVIKNNQLEHKLNKIIELILNNNGRKSKSFSQSDGQLIEAFKKSS